MTLLVADWLLGRSGASVVSHLGINDRPDVMLATVQVQGWAILGLDLVAHWLPRAAATYLLVWVVLRRLEGRRDEIPPIPSAMSLRAAIGVVVVLLLYHVLARRLHDQPLGLAVEFREFPGRFLAIFALRFGPSAFCEETVYRGGVFRALRLRYGTVPAAILAVIPFGLGHLYGGLSLAAGAAVLGLAFTALYVRTGGLGAGILAHTVSNIIHMMLRT